MERLSVLYGTFINLPLDVCLRIVSAVWLSLSLQTLPSVSRTVEVIVVDDESFDLAGIREMSEVL